MSVSSSTDNAAAIIAVDPLTNEPHRLWEEFYIKERICNPLQTLVRFVIFRLLKNRKNGKALLNPLPSLIPKLQL